MTIDISLLADRVAGRSLPGGGVTVESHESAIADEALRSSVDPVDAHPAWFVIASLRGMGITVDELCELAHQGPTDLLLFGSCTVTQRSAMKVGMHYTTSAAIGDVSSRLTRDGARLDSLEVRVTISETRTGLEAGEVVSVYLFKRGDTA